RLDIPREDVIERNDARARRILLDPDEVPQRVLEKMHTIDVRKIDRQPTERGGAFGFEAGEVLVAGTPKQGHGSDELLVNLEGRVDADTPAPGQAEAVALCHADLEICPRAETVVQSAQEVEVEHRALRVHDALRAGAHQRRECSKELVWTLLGPVVISVFALDPDIAVPHGISKCDFSR